MSTKVWGVLGPDPERLRKPDPRVAADWYEYTVYLSRLAKERPELMDRFFLDDERLTMH
jgi:hypothetical protein